MLQQFGCHSVIFLRKPYVLLTFSILTDTSFVDISSVAMLYVEAGLVNKILFTFSVFR